MQWLEVDVLVEISDLQNISKEVFNVSWLQWQSIKLSLELGKVSLYVVKDQYTSLHVRVC